MTGAELDWMSRWRAAQARVRAWTAAAGEPDFRTQYHTDLSPLGWHCGHCAFVETFWIREVLGEDDRATAPWHGLYVPERIERPARGPALPPLPELLAWVRRLQDDNLTWLRTLQRARPRHPLLQGRYLVRFLVQHYAQHLETMQMVLHQRRLRRRDDSFRATRRLRPRRGARARVQVPGGCYCIGSAAVEAYDNERPAHWVEIEAAELARDPVCNAEYLAFIEDGGYRARPLWDDEGWRWRCAGEVEAPLHWRRDRGGAWYAIEPGGPAELDADAPVTGLSRYEAQAYARWAGAALVSEPHWEVAARGGLLRGVGHAWEWCADAFRPYPGFEPFPYDGYSLPWFDGNHFVLRGGSRHTRPEVRRVSFRNFYTPDKRHVFAGIRLQFPAA